MTSSSSISTPINATYAYPGAPACLTNPQHICAYVCADELYTRIGVVADAWPKCGDTADEAIACYLAHSRFAIR